MMMANNIRAVVKIKKNLILFFVLSNHVKYSPRALVSTSAHIVSYYVRRMMDQSARSGFQKKKIQQKQKEQRTTSKNVREFLSPYFSFNR